jgi:hypothetical protein
VEAVLLLRHSSSDDGGGAACFFTCAFMVIGLIIVVAKLVGGTGPTKLLQQGLVAKGILLRVDIPATRWAAEGGRMAWQRRRLRIDVELPGHAPYEVDTLVQFPTNMSGSILPGATVELRVDPKKKDRVVISGPGVALGAGFFNPTSTS